MSSDASPGGEPTKPLGWVVVCWRRDLLVAAYMNDSGKPYTREEAEHEAADLNEPDASSSFTYTIEPLGHPQGDGRFTLAEVADILDEDATEIDSMGALHISMVGGDIYRTVARSLRSRATQGGTTK